MASASADTKERDELLKAHFAPLTRWFNAQRMDHFTLASADSEKDVVAAGYKKVSDEGFLAKQNLVRTSAVDSFWSFERQDNFTTGDDNAKKQAAAAEYKQLRTEGFAWAKNPNGSLVPLKKFFKDACKDHLIVSSADSIAGAIKAGYTLICDDVFVVPASISVENLKGLIIGAHLPWTLLEGEATRISSGNPKMLVAVNSKSGKAFVMDHTATEKKWTELPDAKPDIVLADASEDGTLFYLDKAGKIYKHAEGKSTLVPGEATWLSVGSGKFVACCNKAGKIHLLDPAKTEWVECDGEAERVSIGEDGELWAVNKGSIWKRDVATKSWTQIPGTAADIHCEDARNVWMCNADTDIFRLVGRHWVKFNGKATNVSTGGGLITAAGTGGKIYTSPLPKTYGS